MKRKSLDELCCSTARTLDILGDHWSLLLVRDAMYGYTRFSDFQQRLGISRNILSNRLEHLIEHDIMKKVEVRPGVSRYDYKLTARGLELLPILIALMQWGDKWIFGSKGEPIRVFEAKTHAPIRQIGIYSEDGRYLTPGDLDYEPGPAATDEVREAHKTRPRALREAERDTKATV